MPSAPDDDAPLTPPRGRLFRRAAVLHCPACGQGHLFRRWFRMVERCPGCGLHFQRERGQWTGHLGLNTIVSFGALLITLLVFALVTWPELPAVPAILSGLAIAAFVPVLFFPWSKTLWLAFDLVLNPLRPGELDPAAPRASAPLVEPAPPVE